MRYFLYIAFNGAAYAGWQRQPNAPSIQQTVEEALEVLFKKEVPILGAGRTDAGVNAYELPAHVDLPIEGAEKIHLLRRSLNGILPRDVYIRDIKQVTDTAHARFDAKERTYYYFVAQEKDPFVGPFVLPTFQKVDFEAMNRAAALLLGTQDFTSFTKLHNDANHNRCTVLNACWQEASWPGVWLFSITANRFLRNMVRAIVGTLLEVGKGKMEPEVINDILQQKDRCVAAASAKPYPLFLQKVTYPKEIFIR